MTAAIRSESYSARYVPPRQGVSLSARGYRQEIKRELQRTCPGTQDKAGKVISTLGGESYHRYIPISHLTAERTALFRLSRSELRNPSQYFRRVPDDANPAEMTVFRYESSHAKSVAYLAVTCSRIALALRESIRTVCTDWHLTPLLRAISVRLNDSGPRSMTSRHR